MMTGRVIAPILFRVRDNAIKINQAPNLNHQSFGFSESDIFRKASIFLSSYGLQLWVYKTLFASASH
jgi:hypothetical protein